VAGVHEALFLQTLLLAVPHLPAGVALDGHVALDSTAQHSIA
jgi:hypothetical protein